ncbi:MAG: hypothetical protein M3177_08695 [Pseudomonadota bacterium]|nr:hypothetical protein [Pseudomonadota bacterium]
MAARVYSIESLNISVVKTNPPGLQVHVEGQVTSSGWTSFALNHFVYITPPADGIYEADMVGEPPSDVSLPVLTPFEHAETRMPFPDDLKGLKVYSATNSVTATIG